MGASRDKLCAHRRQDWLALCYADQRTVRGDGRAAERFILSNARLLDVDYGASRYVPWSAIASHRLPSCVYVTPVSVRWW
jgi:hypothetical protein